MKKFTIFSLAGLVSFIAYGWVPAAMSGDTEPTPDVRASEYVYLHQTRTGGNALQEFSDRSRLQCVAN